MNKLVSCMIVKNAEDTIKKCVESLLLFSDKVVVVDTGSTDNTMKIMTDIYARKALSQLFVYERKWEDDFSAARNESFKIGRELGATHLFWMDADDYITPEDAQELRERFESMSEDVHTIMMPYIYCKDNNTGTSVSTLYRERLFRINGDFPKWNDPVHEYVGDLHKYNKVYWDDINIHHDRRYMGGTERNLNIYKKYIESGKELNCRMHFYYANELMGIGSFDEAIKHYKVVIEDEYAWQEDRHKSAINIANHFNRKEKHDSALYWYFRAFCLDARFAEPFFNIGDIFMKQERYQEAIDFLKVAIVKHKPEGVLLSTNESQSSYLAKVKIYECYVKLEKYDKAIQYCKLAIKDLPEKPTLKSDLEFMKNARNQSVYNKYKDKPIRLDIGSGGLKREGIISCDLFDKSADLNFPMHDIPFPNKTVDMIVCEHALEHTIHYKEVLDEFTRIIKPGGKLYLEVPDFDECVRLMREAGTDDKVSWYKKTIYGRHYTDGEIDMGQIHYYGFDTKELKYILFRLGFYVYNTFNRDHCGTPSIYIKAVKKTKIMWMAGTKDIDNASSRLRKLNVSKRLSSHHKNIESLLFDDLDRPIKQNADIVVVTSFDNQVMEKIDEYHANGIVTVYDHNEAILDFPGVKEALSKVNHVVCCSEKLKELTLPVNPNCLVIEDMWE